MTNFLRALSLLTVIPVRATWDDSVVAARTVGWFPLVGAVLGALLWAAALGLAQLGGLHTVPMLPGVLLVTAWAALTGGLHLDGWADCSDALFAAVPKEKRFQIMKDPHLGSFGVTGLVLLLLLKIGAIQSLIIRGNTAYALAPLFLAPILGRWAIAIAAWRYPLAKQEGMAAKFRQGLGLREVMLATTITALACLPFGLRGLMLLASALVAMLLYCRLAVSRLDGVTGDVYGATVEWVETVVLVSACTLPQGM
ncbi:MAG: cobalamin 5'-phosphate synthase [Lentisphaerae bacterium RIFOXYB12_FULL_65_16]|nr:MAG: cobalamin 5'-phosphate synthase [Lentisphaerae bacterium RIFOXYA12_64_32]OGV86900.1 MAG: cobalamin 5'-phosphate synthase [Lentisphaerae bacterium RIFOXYB12_FULL_65_16]